MLDALATEAAADDAAKERRTAMAIKLHEQDRHVAAAFLAASLAQQAMLPHGTLWEAAVARQIAVELATREYSQIRDEWLLKLGLRGVSAPADREGKSCTR